MRGFLVFALVSTLFTAPAAACSVKEGYKVPTNFELVQKASVIVLARVGEFPADAAPPSGLEPEVRLEPVNFLKGQAATQDLKLMGWNPPNSWGGGVVTTTTLSQSHFSSGLGACVRQFYRPGELVVAMFEPNTHVTELPNLKLVQLFEPFARVAETVDGPDDVWVHAVQKYIALQSGPAENVNTRIQSAIVELNALGTAESQAIAADLEYQITRKEPTAVWVNASTPISTTAGIVNVEAARLYCLPGTPPGMMIVGSSASTGELSVGGVPFEARSVPLSPVEKSLINPPSGFTGAEKKVTTLLRLSDGPGLLAAMHQASGSAEIKVDGKSLGSGRPLDALLRFASQCEKLQKLPAPTEQELDKPRA